MDFDEDNEKLIIDLEDEIPLHDDFDDEEDDPLAIDEEDLLSDIEP